MKILQINKYHYIKGGADTVFFNTQELLIRYGHSVIPFCIKDEDNFPSQYSNYFVHAPEIRKLPFYRRFAAVKRFIWNSDAAKKIEDLVLDEKPDVAHLHNIFNAHSLSILPVLKKHNIPVVITLHDTRFICPSSYFNMKGRPCDKCLSLGGLNCGLYRCYQDDFLNSWMCTLEMFHKEKCFDYDKYIDKYIFVSNRYMNYHSKRHEYFAKKGSVLYNFLPDLRNILPDSNKGKYLFYYGRITTEKGLRTLIDVMKDMPELKLKVAGTGPLFSEFQSQELKNVELLGYQTGDSLWQLVKNASFVIVPSECEENNPLTIIESYAYGKPVIGATTGGIPEIIKDGKTGFLFKTGSKDDLKAKIQKASKLSDEEYAVLSKNAREYAECNFSPEHYYMELEKIYKEIIAKHR